MTTITFFPIDIGYTVLHGSAVIHLFGRTLDGQQICVRDPTFKPYFYLIAPPGANLGEIKTTIRTFKTENAVVTGTEDVTINKNEHQVHAIKIFTNLPKSVPAIRELTKQLGQTHEYDIKYHRRYLIDKRITPFTLTTAEGTWITAQSRVPVFEAEKISPVEQEQTLHNPRILAIDIECYNPNGKNIDASQHPIIMLAVYGDGFKRQICWKRFHTTSKDIDFVNSEIELLEHFAHLVEEYKPDMIAGYYSDGFDLPFIKTRCEKLGIKLKLGLDHSEMIVREGAQGTADITGITHWDVFRFIRRVIGRNMRTDVFTLDAVSAELLGSHKHDVDLENLARIWDNRPELLEQYCLYNLQDAKLTFDLCQKVLPNIIELVKIIGQPLLDINRMSFSQLVEWYCIRQAGLAGEMAPNKPNFPEERARKQQRLKGAFVYEPTPGLYTDIVVFDYRSLYPSIIASHNISPGTLNCTCCEGLDDAPVEGFKYWYCKNEKDSLAALLKTLSHEEHESKNYSNKQQKNN